MRIGTPAGTFAVALLLATEAAAEPQFEEVVVMGQRNLLNQGLVLGDNSQSVSRSGQVSLNRTVGDWIHGLPGVSLNGQGGLLQSYSVRGFSRWRIRTEVDGVPIITDRRAGNSASFISPELLEAATVDSGPASSLYGSGAMGGIVSLNSIDPRAPTTTVEAQDNGNGLATTLSYAPNQALGGAMSIRRAGNTTDARGRTLNTQYQQANALVKSSRLMGNQKLSISWLGAYGNDIGKSNSDFPLLVETDYPEEMHSILSIQVDLDSNWLARLYHHYQNWSVETSRPTIGSNTSDYQGHTVGGMLYGATHYLSGVGRYGLEWIGRRGVSISHRDFEAEGLPRLFVRNIDGELDNIGLFVDHQWISGPLIYGGGIRYDHIRQSGGDSSRQDRYFNASASGEWNVSETWSISAQLGSGFRFPSLSELYFNGETPRGFSRGNPDLKPERNLGLQLGLEYQHNAISASLHSYYNDLDNYIERFAVTDNLRSFRNLDNAHIKGYELQLNWSAGEQWTHNLSYQWQRGKDKQGNWLADLNPPAWRYLVSWQSADWQLRSDLLYRDSRAEFGAGEQALESTVNWSMQAAKSLNAQWQAELYVDNVLNELTLATADEDAAYQPGRTVGVRLRWVGS